MNRFIRIALLLAVFTVIGTTAAYAQATRTWVSGVGDDANPCSRTAPCKTFAGAISKTAAGGEISVLDPGGFGCVTITKSITLNGEGTLAGILGAGSISCVNINDSASGSPGTIFVTLRHLSIVGNNSASSTGINFVSGAALIMEHLIVQQFATGIRTAMGHTSAQDVTVVRNTTFGARAQQTAGQPSTLSFEDSLFTNNGIAVQTEQGTIIRLSDSAFYNNGTAFVCTGTGAIASAGDNRKANNPAVGCTPTITTTLQ